MAKKITRKAVNEACGRYGDLVCRYGEDNLATVRALVAFHDLRRQWEEQNGRAF
jgi:hypothetical protein